MHKLRNFTGHLPKPERAQVKSAFRAARKLEADEGKRKLEQRALWLEREHLWAAASLREGLDELFTIGASHPHVGPPPLDGPGAGGEG